MHSNNSASGADQLPPIKFKELNDALLARIGSLVQAWVPGGVVRNDEYSASSPFRPEKSPSFSVCIAGDNIGRWADFGGPDRGGDLVSLYAALHGLGMGKAALQVARAYGLEDVAGVMRSEGHVLVERPPAPPAPPPKPPRIDEKWATQRPVPDFAPKPEFKHPARAVEDIQHTAEYRHGADLMGYVVRFRTSTGGKETLPYTWCVSQRSGGARWTWKQFDEPRPLYLPAFTLPAGQTVILVEGERKGDVLQALLDAGAPGVYIVATWPGGCKAWKKVDWSPLAGQSVICWPDCDSHREMATPKERNACADEAALQALKLSKPYLAAEKQPGMAAMLGIGALLRDAQGCSVQLLPIDGPGIKPDGWDAADAIETDGWDFDRVLAFFATAIALPPAEGEKPEAAKKIDDPVDTEGMGFPGSDDAGEESTEPTRSGDLPWWLRPYWDAVKGRWNISRKTVILALRNVPELAGVLGYNLLSNTMEARHDWPFPHGKRGKITGAIDLLLGNWLSQSFKTPAISRQALMEAMETVAYENPWHPVQEWLGGLEWDGTSRIDKWLIYAIGETPESLTPDMLEYLTLVGRCWLIGAVKRVMEPGCKFDYCPVLEGRGGLGKSTMVETLAGSSWYSDTPFEIGKGKESQEQVQGIWFYEMGELSQMGKSEINAIKAFISSKVDRYRPAYGRVIEEHPRQCVLVGTTNENTYLRDRTGNRRFWPIPVRHQIRINWLAKFRDQLFAEAFQLYLQGAACIPTEEQEKRLFVPLQESRLVETAVTSELMAVLMRSPTPSGIGAVVNQLTNFVTLSQLAKSLDVDAGKSTAGLESQIRSWMNQQGWDYKKKQIEGVRAYGWVRPSDWPPVETDTDAPPSGAADPATGGGVDFPQDDDEPF